MENKDISEIVLKNIKEKGLKPTSRIFFIFKKLLFWFLIGASILVGSVSFAFVMSLLLNNDWYLYKHLGLFFIFKTIPFFWLICLTSFIFLAEFYYKKTYFGYRHRVIYIIGIYLIITVLIGFTFYSFGLDSKFENSLYQKVPVYRTINLNRQEIWSQPDKGFLSGEIISVKGESVKILDLNNMEWEIDIKDAIIGGRADLVEDQNIKILGEVKEKGVFSAQEIRPMFNNRAKLKMMNSNKEKIQKRRMLNKVR